MNERCDLDVSYTSRKEKINSIQSLKLNQVEFRFNKIQMLYFIWYKTEIHISKYSYTMWYPTEMRKKKFQINYWNNKFHRPIFLLSYFWKPDATFRWLIPLSISFQHSLTYTNCLYKPQTINILLYKWKTEGSSVY